MESDGRVLCTRAGSLRCASEAARVVGSGPGRPIPFGYRNKPCSASRRPLLALPPDALAYTIAY